MGQKLATLISPRIPLTAYPAMRMPRPVPVPSPRRSERIPRPTQIFNNDKIEISRTRRPAPAIARLPTAPPSIRAVHPPLEVTHIIRELNLRRLEKIAKKQGQIAIPEERIALATKKFKNNKHSDEYYTRSASWARFVEDAGLAGKTIYEPFFGDGSSRDELAKLGVTQIGKAGDFWENIVAPDCPQDFIMSNPPFSFKWEIIETLLERKRSFALILSWQTFYQTNARHLARLHEKYGGEYLRYGMRGEEVMFYSPKDEKMMPIGTSILLWTF